MTIPLQVAERGTEEQNISIFIKPYTSAAASVPHVSNDTPKSTTTTSTCNKRPCSQVIMYFSSHILGRSAVVAVLAYGALIRAVSAKNAVTNSTESLSAGTGRRWTLLSTHFIVYVSTLTCTMLVAYLQPPKVYLTTRCRSRMQDGTTTTSIFGTKRRQESSARGSPRGIPLVYCTGTKGTMLRMPRLHLKTCEMR